MANKNKKQIVFVNQSSGYLMIDIIHSHLKDYDELILVTGFLNPRNNPLDKRVKVHMLNSYDRNSTVTRLYTWLVFSLKVWFLLFFKYREANVYFVSNPPFVVFIARLLKNKYSFLIYDVYPDVLVQYNVLKKDSFFVKLWAQTNRTVFAKANHLYTIGSGMKTLVANYISENKVAIVPIWSDNEFLKPIERCDNLFIKKYQLEEKFVIMYSGNLGKTHPVEILLEIAFELNHESVEVFVIGEGEKKKALISAAEKRDITNIHFLPYQDVAYFPISLAASDLSVVTLSNEAAQLSVPSKIFNIMSVKAPILAIGGSESELAYLLKTHENGADFNESQMVEILKFVRKLMNDKCFYNLLATNSLKASLMYTPINANRLKF